MPREQGEPLCFCCGCVESIHGTHSCGGNAGRCLCHGFEGPTYTEETHHFNKLIDAESRARAIRAVVAAQWGVACALHAQSYCQLFEDTESIAALARVVDIRAAGSLPCAVDLVGDGT